MIQEALFMMALQKKRNQMIDQLGMPEKRRATWGGGKAYKLFAMRNRGDSMTDIYRAFPAKTTKSIHHKLHMMGFSTID